MHTLEHLKSLAIITSLLFLGCSSDGEDDGQNGGGTGGAVTMTGGTGPGTGGAGTGGDSLGTGGDPLGTGGGSGGTPTGTGGDTLMTGGAPGTGGDAPGTGGDTGSGGDTGTGGSDPITCPSPSLSPGDTTRTITVGGQQRTYELHVPSQYDGSSAVPFIIDFHGITGNGPGQRNSSPYPAQTDPDGVIMAFPTGLPGPIGNAWNVGPCCVADVDDVEFARAMIEDVSSEACIDPKRVYAVGFSMGGGMSHYLACHAADVFAAVAPAAFDLLEENVDDCQPSRPITVVSFRGTSDNVVAYDGGDSAVVPGMPITFLGAEDTFEKWADLNSCQGSPEDAGGGCSTYSNCADGVTVTLCTAQGGGHAAGNASFAWPILKQNVLP